MEGPVEVRVSKPSSPGSDIISLGRLMLFVILGDGSVASPES